MDKKNKKNNSIFSLVVSILTLAVITVGSTFAFFSSVVKSEKEVEVKSANFKLAAKIDPLYNSKEIIPTDDEDIMKSINEVLSLDPRPSYHDDPVREYGMTFGKYNIRFRVDGDILHVCHVL